jgi:hypothetical protein
MEQVHNILNKCYNIGIITCGTVWMISSLGVPFFASKYVIKLGENVNLKYIKNVETLYNTQINSQIIPSTKFENDLLQSYIYPYYVSYGFLSIPISLHYICETTIDFVFYKYFNYKNI